MASRRRRTNRNQKPQTTMPAPVLHEIASTRDGRDITRGLVYDLLPPQDEILLLKGGGDYKIYEKILQDDQVASCFQQRRLAVVSREWEILPGGSRPIDQAAADFLRWQLNRLPWDDITDKQLYGIFYGFSFAELLWQIHDARIIAGAIKVRNRRRFRFWQDGSPRLITTSALRGEPLPGRKFWTFCVGADNSDDPYGRGLAHYLYWPVWLKNNGLKFWSIFLEKFGQPTAIGEYPPGTSEEQQKQLLELLNAIRTETGVTLPHGMAIHYLEASRSGTADYSAFVRHMDLAISKIILSQTMTTEAGSSYSQSKVHEGVKDEIVKADADLICSSFTAGPAKWLTRWNFPGAATPQVWRILEDQEDVNHRSERDARLFNIGVRLRPEAIPDVYGPEYATNTTEQATEDVQQLNGQQIASLVDILVKVQAGELSADSAEQVLRIAFPSISPEQAKSLVASAARQQAPEPGTRPPDIDPNPNGLEFAEPQPPENPERIVGKLAQAAQPLIDDWLRQIRQRLTAGEGDLASFGAELANLYPELAGAEFAAVMGEALVLARLAGMSDGGER